MTCMAYQCSPYPSEPMGAGKEDLSWVVLFSWSLNGGWFALSILLSMIVALFSGIIPASIGFWWSGKNGARAALLIEFVIFWLHEILTIERSLKLNSIVNTSIENDWGFGQASTSKCPSHHRVGSLFMQIITLFLSLPLAETLFTEICHPIAPPALDI